MTKPCLKKRELSISQYASLRCTFYSVHVQFSFQTCEVQKVNLEYFLQTEGAQAKIGLRIPNTP